MRRFHPRVAHEAVAELGLAAPQSGGERGNVVHESPRCDQGRDDDGDDGGRDDKRLDLSARGRRERHCCDHAHDHDPSGDQGDRPRVPERIFVGADGGLVCTKRNAQKLRAGLHFLFFF